MDTKSDSIKELAAALAKAQSAIRSAEKDRENPFFKSSYATIASVWEACRKPLTDNGLSVSQLPSAEGSTVTVTTLLMHASGEWLASELVMTATKADPQGIGSAITYARRYALSAMVGVAPDDDDDGNDASHQQQQQARPAARQQKSRPEPKPEPPPAQDIDPVDSEKFFSDFYTRLISAPTDADAKAIGEEIQAVTGRLLDEHKKNLRTVYGDTLKRLHEESAATI